MRSVGLLAVFVFVAPASAATKAPTRTVVRFDGDDIDGRLRHPDGELLAGRRARDDAPLSRPPASFDDEARADRIRGADALRRRPR